RLKEDLLLVARKVPHCYPEEWGVPGLYASLYHRGFADRLTKLARTGGLGADECSYLLFWILTHQELQGVFPSDGLGVLVPQTELNQLEDQYLAHKQDFARRNHDNSHAVMKANLVSIQQFRSFLEKQEDFLSGDQRVALESSLRALEDCGYGGLTCPIHLEMRLLLGRLHEEVLQEYLRRMMKGKRESLQLEVATLAMHYPDLRNSHVAALMSLKSNLSAADARVIKQCLQETRPQQPSTNHNGFFSRVHVRWIDKMKP
ncbi:hypothetical protein CRUP_033130, partial [Coryphaenoides rupestris]